ncbi:MAG: 30S ribosomal protein S18 [candidate division Zixibacteria bacterium]|nr:30S ribosomal protein S18 [candidate division Zixibacteria bacterium]
MAFNKKKKSKFGDKRRKRHCRFCENHIDVVDFRDDRLLRRFVTERGKIIPRRISGTCARHQRTLTTSIKRARHLAIMPFVAETFK